MKVGVLFSGGKDSAYALYKASRFQEVVCLLTMKSQNPDSYMFHTPNIHITELQAKALGIPLVSLTTKGEKEKELEDLKRLIQKAKKEHGIEGIVTGAVASVYQATRVQKICSELKLWCFNPLWQQNQIELLKDLLEHKFKVIIAGIAAFPFDQKFLGKPLDAAMIRKLSLYALQYKINPAGEGGEYETLVLDMPLFRKNIIIKESEETYANNAGVFHIISTELKNKEEQNDTDNKSLQGKAE